MVNAQPEICESRVLFNHKDFVLKQYESHYTLESDENFFVVVYPGEIHSFSYYRGFKNLSITRHWIGDFLGELSLFNPYEPFQLVVMGEVAFECLSVDLKASHFEIDIEFRDRHDFRPYDDSNRWDSYMGHHLYEECVSYDDYDSYDDYIESDEPYDDYDSYDDYIESDESHDDGEPTD